MTFVNEIYSHIHLIYSQAKKLVSTCLVHWMVQIWFLQRFSMLKFCWTDEMITKLRAEWVEMERVKVWKGTCVCSTAVFLAPTQGPLEHMKGQQCMNYLLPDMQVVDTFVRRLSQCRRIGESLRADIKILVEHLCCSFLIHIKVVYRLDAFSCVMEWIQMVEKIMDLAKDLRQN